MRSETDLAWAAGLFEGEGCFTVRRIQKGWRAQFEMQLVSTDEDVVVRFHRVAGVGYRKQKKIINSKPHWKPQYTWACGGDLAIKFAWDLLPYLGQRRLARFQEIMEIISESQPKARPCECCAQEFEPTRFARERFCSDRCRDRSKYLRRKYGVANEAEFALVAGAIPGTSPHADR